MQSSAYVAPLAGGVPADLGAPRLPGSKSHTQRALLLAAFAPGERRIRGALRSDDTAVLGAALRACGASVVWEGDALAVRGRAGGPAAGDLDVAVDCGENATAARALLVLVPLLGGRIRVDGAPALRQRPMGPVVELLHAAGVSYVGTSLPITADGRSTQWSGRAFTDAAVTTQAATGAVLAAALRGGGEVTVRGAMAPGYLLLTAHVCRAFGCAVDVVPARGIGPTAYAVRVAAGPRGGGDVAIPADPSSRAFPLALAALHGRDATALLPRLQGDPHPDWAIDGDLRALRDAGTNDVVLDDTGTRPDCAPALAVVAAVRPATTVLRGLANLRGKESDRLQALADGLAAAGASCTVEGDALRIRGPLRSETPGTAGPRALPAPPDHRIVMALALCGTVLPGGVTVPHAASVAKSWPDYFAWLGRCARVTLSQG